VTSISKKRLFSQSFWKRWEQSWSSANKLRQHNDIMFISLWKASSLGIQLLSILLYYTFTQRHAKVNEEGIGNTWDENARSNCLDNFTVTGLLVSHWESLTIYLTRTTHSHQFSRVFFFSFVDFHILVSSNLAGFIYLFIFFCPFSPTLFFLSY